MCGTINLKPNLRSCLDSVTSAWPFDIQVLWLFPYSEMSSLWYPVVVAVVVQLLSHAWPLVTPWTAACQNSLSFTISPNLFKLMSLESVMASNHLILCHPLLLLLSVFPSIRVSSNESALRIRWQNYWSFSFSISPPHEYSGLISCKFYWFDPCHPRNSQESSTAPQFESISSLVLSLLYGPTLTSVHDYWKNHSFDYLDLCQQSTISAF